MPNFIIMSQSVAKIYRFLKMAVVRCLCFDWCVFGPLTKSIGGLYHRGKFG